MKKASEIKKLTIEQAVIKEYNLFSQTDSPKSSYDQEVAYQNSEENNIQTFNINYKNLFYGKIDKNKNYIVPNISFISEIENTPTSHYLLSFVRDAYQDFRREWDRLVRNNKLNPTNVYDVNPQKSYEHYEIVYSDYMRDHYNSFLRYVNSEKAGSQIVDFASFLNVFSKYISFVSADKPLSLSGFISSKYCSNYISGLCLSFSDLNPNLYGEKVDNFFLNENFKIYNELAVLHGFIVDKNSPWKLIANLESDKMKNYIKKYSETKDVYSTFFQRADYKDLEYIKRYMIEFYNELVNKKPETTKIESSICNGKNIIKKRIINRKLINEKEKVNQINRNSKEWLRFYLFIKTNEFNLNLNQSNFNKLADSVYRISSRLDSEATMRYLSSEIKKYPTAKGRNRNYNF
jgi:hypothetical protein